MRWSLSLWNYLRSPLLIWLACCVSRPETVSGQDRLDHIGRIKNDFKTILHWACEELGLSLYGTMRIHSIQPSHHLQCGSLLKKILVVFQTPLSNSRSTNGDREWAPSHVWQTVCWFIFYDQTFEGLINAVLAFSLGDRIEEAFL